jgi:hypothetical protein
MSEKDITNSEERSVGSGGGTLGSSLVETIPQRNNLESEYVIQGQSNSCVVLGRDRLASEYSTNYYGNLGTPGSGMIDLCAGLSSQDPQRVVTDSDTGEEQEVLTNPDPFQDAARCYIAQRTNCDIAFGLADGQYGSAKNGSAVVNKADHIRLIGRQSIKICTGTDATSSVPKMTKNPDGSTKYEPQDSRVKYGIDLIAGNDDSNLEFMVKGESLCKYLREVGDDIDRLQGLLQTFIQIQTQFNLQIAHHFHLSPFFGIPTAPDKVLIKAFTSFTQKMVQVTKSTMAGKFNVTNKKMSYLSPAGENYILSRYNKTN